MDHRTRGIVIALTSSVAGGLLPAAVSEQMASMYLMAVGLGAVVVLNAVVAFIHINGVAETDRAGRLRGIVIALTSAAVGGLLPAAVSALLLGTYTMAAGLAAVVMMNAAVAFIHIVTTLDAANETLSKSDIIASRLAMSAANVELNAANSGADVTTMQMPAKDSLNFPVMGWYSLPEDVEDVPPEIAKKAAKSRA